MNGFKAWIDPQLPVNCYLSKSAASEMAIDLLLGRQVGVSEKGCWLWECIDRNGYGLIVVRSGMRRFKFGVHRLSYEYYKRQRSPGLVLRHSCDVRNCWNPEHLAEGTKRENAQDMIKRGRAGWQSGQGDEKPEIAYLMDPPRKVSSLAMTVLRNEHQRKSRP